MIWSYFIIFAIISVVLWAIGAWAAWRNHRLVTFGATGLGLIVFFCLYSHYVDNIRTSTSSYNG